MLGCSGDVVSGPMMGVRGLDMGLSGILSGLTKSTEHLNLSSVWMYYKQTSKKMLWAIETARLQHFGGRG